MLSTFCPFFSHKCRVFSIIHHQFKIIFIRQWIKICQENVLNPQTTLQNEGCSQLLRPLLYREKKKSSLFPSQPKTWESNKIQSLCNFWLEQKNAKCNSKHIPTFERSWCPSIMCNPSPYERMMLHYLRSYKSQQICKVVRLQKEIYHLHLTHSAGVG